MAPIADTKALGCVADNSFGGLRFDANMPTDRLTKQWPCTLLLHGWGGSSRSWTKFGPLVESELVLCPDLRGFGASPEGGLAPAFHQHVSDMAELVVRLAAKGRVAIIGHSYGGLIAQEIAARHPEHVGALVLLSTQSRCRQFTLAKPTESLVMSINDEASRDTAVARLIPRYYRQGSVTRQEMDALIADGCRATPRALRESLLSAAQAKPLDAQELTRLRAPVLTMTGQYDILPSAMADQVAGMFVNGVGAIIPGAAHCAAYDQPFALAALVNPFLERALTLR